MLLRALGEIVLRALWLPLAVLLLHLFGMFVLGVYDMVSHLDVLTHLVGGAAIAWFFRRSLGILRRHRILEPVDTRSDVLILLGLVCAATVAWEMGEYVLDSLAGTRWQQSLEDTLKDQLSGLVGGVVYAAAAFGRGR